MKKILALMIIVSVSSCSDIDNKNVVTDNRLQPVCISNTDIGPFYGIIKLYVIDSCEYIGNLSVGNSSLLTHKGNCKYCENRKK